MNCENFDDGLTRVSPEGEFKPIDTNTQTLIKQVLSQRNQEILKTLKTIKDYAHQWISDLQFTENMDNIILKYEQQLTEEKELG